MTALRRRLSAIGLLLLLFQTASFAMSPIASCCTNTTQNVEDAGDCCKGMAPGQMCPLHHRRVPSNDSSQHQDGAAAPALRCGCSPMDPALFSLSFGLGVLLTPLSVDVIPVSHVVTSDDDSVLTIPLAITSPPPRS
jgi:hypothetical protein